jgi:formylglycine-generating enzyme required for sulfatase activity
MMAVIAAIGLETTLREGPDPLKLRPGDPAYDPRAAELALWQSVEKLGRVDAYRDYLSRYPDGQFSTQAKLHLAGLTRPVIGHPTTSVEFRDCADCPEMVRIPAGSFRMGSAQSEIGRQLDEGPLHWLRVPAFAIGKYAVTFDEWDSCVRAGACTKHPDDNGWGRGRRPVINVSWDDAQQYVRWLSRKTDKNFRLPSEAEWEYAARAGTTTAYYWGPAIGSGYADCDGCGSKWDNSKTASVGSFAPNPWGLYDMLGNVEQMTQDCWHENYPGAPIDGSAWMAGDCKQRVIRGGSWGDDPRNVRAAHRNRGSATEANRTLGFRVAMTAD